MSTRSKKFAVAAACILPYLIFMEAGGIHAAHAAGDDTHAHITKRAARRTDSLDVYLDWDDFSEHDIATEVDGDWSTAASIHYSNYDNFYDWAYDGADLVPVGTATFSDMDFSASGDYATGVSIQGNYTPGDTMTVNIHDSLIKADGVGAAGVAVSNHTHLNLDGVELKVKGEDDPYGWGTKATGLTTWGDGVRVEMQNSTVQVERGAGLDLSGDAQIQLDSSHVRTWGDDTAHGLVFNKMIGNGNMQAPGNHVRLTNDSSVHALDASAIWVDSRATNVLDASDSRLSGDRLVTLAEGINIGIDDGMPPRPESGWLSLTARNSHLEGGSDVHAQGRLSMHLHDASHWEIRPSSAGVTRSEVTFLSLQDSDIRFNPNHTGLYQRLVVGHGDTEGRTDVYQALGNNARIALNTYLNEGGALAQQQTDRVVILGDATGSTWLQVTPVAGSPGAETGDTARDGISVAQVYGQASGQSFQLAGDYVAVGPYQYRLQSFDPDASDPEQRDPEAGGAGKFWDFRLLGSMGRTGFGDASTPDVVPQLPSYLAAPTAIFQARLFDIDTWHRRLGDARHAGGRAGKSTASGEHEATGKDRDFYLRTYGGDYDYRSQPGASSYASKTRYHAVQAGGNTIRTSADGDTWRVGAAVSVGDLTFQPQGIEGSRKTRLKSWTVAPTMTWQRANGSYVDALVAVGGFHGDVSTGQRGKTATLKGKSAAISIEAGVPFQMGDLTVLPQVQAVVQQIKFERTRDVDGIDVNLGTHKQVTLRSGAEIRKALQSQNSHTIQLYGKMHVAHAVNDSKQVQLSGDFRTGKTGTVLETGVGLDTTLAKGRGMLYADVTRQSRIGRAGHNGWTANIGVRMMF